MCSFKSKSIDSSLTRSGTRSILMPGSSTSQGANLITVLYSWRLTQCFPHRPLDLLSSTASGFRIPHFPVWFSKLGGIPVTSFRPLILFPVRLLLGTGSILEIFSGNRESSLPIWRASKEALATVLRPFW